MGLAGETALLALKGLFAADDAVVAKMELSKIAKCLVRSVATNEEVSIESLYKNHTCVITFMRRFG